jgi:Flp pilus assembly pilin Flp
MRRFLRKMKSQLGQGMSEYLIIVALIAIAAIGVVSVFGTDIRDLFGASTGALSGNPTATTGAKKATISTKDLKNFGNTNAQ